VIPQNQTGFRKEMGTMDNIYVINYIVNKQLRIGALFVDLRATFDLVDREILYKAIREKREEND